eukprot:FR734753.1.p1 GENE.FR734753.1~~FR734753.1.p1  ORF type:complete len:167 (+),score=14.28 FR734753.1:3-503(+)
MFSHFQSDEKEMIFMSYAGGSLVLLIVCMNTGEMKEGLEFIDGHSTPWGPAKIFVVLLIFSVCGFFGVSCVTALTKRFGALTAALTTTARKTVTIMLSFLLFPKPVGIGHFVGAMMFLAGLAMKSRLKSLEPKKYATAHDSNGEMDVGTSGAHHHSRAMATQVSAV